MYVSLNILDIKDVFIIKCMFTSQDMNMQTFEIDLTLSSNPDFAIKTTVK